MSKRRDLELQRQASQRRQNMMVMGIVLAVTVVLIGGALLLNQANPPANTPAPTPPVVGADALLELLLPSAPVDPWQVVRDAGVSDQMVAQLIAADVTPEAAALKLGIG